jgi:hypothetical protein
MATEAYCVKCKAKREMKNENKITMKNGKPATEGQCPVCGTKMFKIGSGGSSAGAASGEGGATSEGGAKSGRAKASAGTGTRSRSKP